LRSAAIHIIFLLLALAGLPAVQEAHAQQPSRENGVKAVFLYNFTKFVEWPPTAFATPQSPFVIGIIGPDPFGRFLDETVKGEQYEGRPIVVRRFRDIREAGGAHILYINGHGNMKEILHALRGRSILTVSDEDDFATAGGMIRLFTSMNKIRLQINLKSTREAGLNISSKLLRLADIIE